MNSSVLIDTNILIYAIDADSRFHNGALKLLLDPVLKLFTTFKAGSARNPKGLRVYFIDA